MKRWRFFQVAVVIVVAAVALRLLPEVLALSSATVSFGGSYSVGGAGTRLIYCSLNKSGISLTRPTQGNGSVSDTATLTCYNNSASGVTLSISILSSTMAPGGGGAPTYAWSSTSMSVPGGGGSASQTVTVSAKKQDNAGTFTLSFNVSGGTTPSVLDYTHNGYSITITVI